MCAKVITYNAGIKLYRYEDNDVDKFELIRIFKYLKDDNIYVAKILSSWDDNVHPGDTRYLKYEDAHNKYIKINEDGIVSFNILKGEKQDVMVALHIKKDFEEGNNIPFAVCRQDVIDIFKMFTDPPKDGMAWAGISVNRKNCPSEMTIEDFMLCDDVLITKFVHVYCDDTLEDILNCIELSRFDNVLETLQKHRHNTNIMGNVSTVKELLDTHNFMYDFHEAFDIVEVPFLINNDTTHLLKDVISQIIQKVVSDVYIIPYSKTINTNEFERPYVLMTPDWSKCDKEYQNIFIVGYDIDPNIDYLTSKYGTNNKDEIIKKLGFNVM